MKRYPAVFVGAGCSSETARVTFEAIDHNDELDRALEAQRVATPKHDFSPFDRCCARCGRTEFDEYVAQSACIPSATICDQARPNATIRGHHPTPS